MWHPSAITIWEANVGSDCQFILQGTPPVANGWFKPRPTDDSSDIAAGVVENDSADYSSTTEAQHECFGQSASNKCPMSDEFFPYTPSCLHQSRREFVGAIRQTIPVHLLM
jgi:hypothetical protein